MNTALGTQFDLDAASMSVTHVTLNVQNLDRMTHFYRDVIGLTVHTSTSDEAILGTRRPFLTLKAKPDGLPGTSRAPGLFHTAFLVPDRADLSAWMRHAARFGVYPYGASDHNVSEALYLDDPEGNGIEIYADRPVETWTGADGELYMPSHRLDLTTLPAGDNWTTAPAATRIGHVHLQTTDIPNAEAFWTGLGMDVTARYPGGSFFGAGGYHHQIATNTWASQGQPPRQDNMLGLAELTLETDVETLATLTAPSGVSVTLKPKGH